MSTTNAAKNPPEIDLTHNKLSVLEWQNLLDEMESVSGHSETFKEKAIRRTKESPLVVAGALGTVACLTLGLRNLVKGDRAKQQYFMRGRVLAQGFTIAMVVAAMLGGISSKGSISDGKN